ncbi:tRNA glutamyl-Q(34) synthetase GluQRS [Roseobacteraceae bacterium S113]
MITRFAPSPTGPLHLGHAFSALTAFDAAANAGGVCHLRIDDIDESRARPAWEAQIFNDLAWLGMSWPDPVMRQSQRKDRYREALRMLWRRGLLYPCTCTRRDIAAAAAAPQEGAPLLGPDGVVYPGTCRADPTGPMPETSVLRLNMRRATQGMAPLVYFEAGVRQTVSSDHLVHEIGDVVLARRDMAASYHLSVVCDDADQGVTHVIRGADLQGATAIHVVLQQLLGLPTPHYHHHRLIRDDTGKRLAKRDDARAIATYRSEGKTPGDIREMVGL